MRRTKTVTAPNVDLSVQWAELKGAEDDGIDAHLLEALIGSRINGDDA